MVSGCIDPNSRHTSSPVWDATRITTHTHADPLHLPERKISSDHTDVSCVSRMRPKKTRWNARRRYCYFLWVVARARPQAPAHHRGVGWVASTPVCSHHATTPPCAPPPCHVDLAWGERVSRVVMVWRWLEGDTRRWSPPWSLGAWSRIAIASSRSLLVWGICFQLTQCFTGAELHAIASPAPRAWRRESTRKWAAWYASFPAVHAGVCVLDGDGMVRHCHVRNGPELM